MPVLDPSLPQTAQLRRPRAQLVADPGASAGDPSPLVAESGPRAPLLEILPRSSQPGRPSAQSMHLPARPAHSSTLQAVWARPARPY
jgi:hypothetical protein